MWLFCGDGGHTTGLLTASFTNYGVRFSDVNTVLLIVFLAGVKAVPAVQGSRRRLLFIHPVALSVLHYLTIFYPTVIRSPIIRGGKQSPLPPKMAMLGMMVEHPIGSRNKAKTGQEIPHRILNTICFLGFYLVVCQVEVSPARKYGCP